MTDQWFRNASHINFAFNNYVVSNVDSSSSRLSSNFAELVYLLRLHPHRVQTNPVVNLRKVSEFEGSILEPLRIEFPRCPTFPTFPTSPTLLLDLGLRLFSKLRHPSMRIVHEIECEIHGRYRKKSLYDCLNVL